MLNPVKQYTFLFTADGESTSLSIDVSLIPLEEQFAGNAPTAVLSPQVVGNGQIVQGVQASLNGTIVTITFSDAPLQFDQNNNLILYTATFYLQYGQ